MILVFQAKDLATRLENLFVMSLVWSLGATLDADGRARFDAFLRQLVAGEIPARQNVSFRRAHFHTFRVGGHRPAQGPSAPSDRIPAPVY